ncbi:MAG: phosphoglycerate mutase family protein [Steroidobacteraceae bacterium]
MPSHAADPTAPAITRRRRPFLAPVWLSLLGALALAGVALALWASATNTIVVVVPSANGELGSIPNAPLSAAGGQQAQVLAQRFATASGRDGLSAIYVSQTRRAQQTAEPIAQLLGLHPVVLSSRGGESIASEILDQQTGKSVLVVCGRQSIADLVHALSGHHIAPAAERDMYIVTIPRYGPARVLRMHN